VKTIDRLVNRYLSIVIDVICMVILGILVTVVFLNVVFRYVLELPLAWSAELAQILLVWLTFMGAVAAIRRNRHLKIEDLLNRLPPASRRIVYRVINVVVSVFFVLMIWHGIGMTVTVAGQTTDALRVSAAFFYATIPIGFLLMLPYSVYHALTGYRPTEEKS